MNYSELMSEAHDDGSCGGFKHCQNKVYDATDESCRECLDDANEGMAQSMPEINQGAPTPPRPFGELCRELGAAHRKVIELEKQWEDLKSSCEFLKVDKISHEKYDLSWPDMCTSSSPHTFCGVWECHKVATERNKGLF